MGLTLGYNRTVSINPDHVESVQSVAGLTCVRMASGVVWSTPLKKREVVKLIGARLK